MRSIDAVSAEFAVSSWAADAARGETFTYYTGHLASDRYELRAAELPSTPDILAADAAWRLHEDGLVLLTQTRAGDGDFDYVATRTKKGTFQ